MPEARTEPNAAIQGQDAAPGSCPPTRAPRPPVCLHSPVQHEINIERAIAGRVRVAAVADARVAEEEEEKGEQRDSRTHPDPNHGPNVSCPQPRRGHRYPDRGCNSRAVLLARRVCSVAAAQQHRTSGCARGTLFIDAGAYERKSRHVFTILKVIMSDWLDFYFLYFIFYYLFVSVNLS